MDLAAQRLELDIIQFSQQLLFTNTCLCVPVGKNNTSVAAPKVAMKTRCSQHLKEIINYLEPQIIITIGSKALNLVLRLFSLKEPKSFTECVRENREYTIDGVTIIPERHLLARVGANPKTRDLYRELEERLAVKFARAYERFYK